jgi:hypothetical protein
MGGGGYVFLRIYSVLMFVVWRVGWDCWVVASVVRWTAGGRDRSGGVLGGWLTVVGKREKRMVCEKEV